MTLTKRRRRRRVTPRVLRFVQDAALSPVPLAATRVHEQLQQEFPDSEVPSVRTVQLLYNEWRLPDQSGKYWTLGDGDAEDAVLILPVIAELTRRWAEQARRFRPDTPHRGGAQLGLNTARWLVRVRTVAPGMDPEDAWRMAGRYAAAEHWNKDTRYLDLYMALELWRSLEDETQAVGRRLIPPNWWYIGPDAPEAQP